MPDRRQLLFAGIGLPVAMAAGAFAEEENEDPDSESLQAVFPLCGCLQGSPEELHAIVKRFGEAFQCHLLEGLEKNPHCCVWFELMGRANPGEPRWFVVHHAGGSLCYATDVQQMDLAVDRLIQIAKPVNGKKCLPVGIITSFPSRTV